MHKCKSEKKLCKIRYNNNNNNNNNNNTLYFKRVTRVTQSNLHPGPKYVHMYQNCKPIELIHQCSSR